MYQIISEQLFQEDLGEYQSFGIVTASGAKVSDVSPDEETITAFVEMLNRADASEIHLLELINDFL